MERSDPAGVPDKPVAVLPARDRPDRTGRTRRLKLQRRRSTRTVIGTLPACLYVS